MTGPNEKDIRAHVNMDADAPPEVREAVHEMIVKAHEMLTKKPSEYDRLQAQRRDMERQGVERAAMAVALYRSGLIAPPDADGLWWAEMDEESRNEYRGEARAVIAALSQSGGEGVGR